MNDLRDWLRPRWWMVLGGVVVTALLIYLMAPAYTEAQLASTATEFRSAVADAGDLRTIAAGLLDMVFVIGYVATALALSRDNVVSRNGLLLMGVAASADMVENWLVVTGVVRRANLSDSFVDLIRGFGAVKWAGVLLGGALILAGLFTDRNPRNRHF